MPRLLLDPESKHSGTEQETIEGVVDRVVYANEETAWSVIHLRARGRRGKMTVVGSLLGAQPGESLRLRGHWTVNKKFGEQFEASGYTPLLPSTESGIRKYLGSGLVPGIGPAIAERLVDRFGSRTLDVLDNETERLTEVSGIGKVRSQRIRKAWQQQRAVHEVMVFLQGHGISAAYAVRIWRRFGDRAVSVVRQDPYRLALDVSGIGFKMADSVASSLGIAADAPARLAAGALHALAQGTSRGHLFLPRIGLIDEASELLEVPPKAVEEAVSSLARERRTVEVELEKGGVGVYPSSLYDAETEIVHRLGNLLAAGVDEHGIPVDKALSRFEKKEGIELAARQRDAIRETLASPVTVITGGPGTGKTTLIRGLLRLELEDGRQVELAAPTGRAAQRLGEATGGRARTIHRLLEIQPRTGKFQRNSEHPLEADLVVIDEASMLDVNLFRDLLVAIPKGCRLLLVGDVDQLPSVGPGRILGDLIDSGRLRVIRLTEIYRQARESDIVINAHRIREGYLPHLTAEPQSDFFFLEREQPEAALATLEELITRRIPRSFGLDPVDEVQVLTPMRKGLLGTHNLNRTLQERLNPDGPMLVRGGRTLRLGDKVMQTRNNYRLEVFNGDIGRIAEVRASDLELEVDFHGRRVLYETADLDDLVHAYACSVHKAQGSEYPAVILLLHTQHWVMLQRNLLYTAITRGRRLVVVVGNRRALAVAVKSRMRERRRTRTVERLAALPTRIR